MEERKRASVIIMRGSGDERLRQAMTQGLIRDEIADDVNEVLRQIDTLKRELNSVKFENEFLRKREQNAMAAQRRYSKIYTDALAESMKRKEQKDQMNQITWYAILAGITFLIVFAGTCLARLIFG